MQVLYNAGKQNIILQSVQQCAKCVIELIYNDCGILSIEIISVGEMSVGELAVH